MAVKFFGQFLVEKSVVSRESLLKAIQLQELVNLSIGELAVVMGFMSQKEVARVNQAQRSKDMRFGDLAIEMGLITPEQVQDVLEKQKREHLYIGEALVKVGGMNEADLNRYLNEFKADQAFYATLSIAIPPSVPHPDFCEITADLTSKILMRIGRLTFHLEPCSIASSPATADIGACIRFFGDYNAVYIFTCSRDIHEKIAAIMLDQPDVKNESEEIVNDTIMEFVNVVCGNIAAKLAQKQTALEITPPELVECVEKLQAGSGQTGLSFPITFSGGEKAELFIITE